MKKQIAACLIAALLLGGCGSTASTSSGSDSSASTAAADSETLQTGGGTLTVHTKCDILDAPSNDANVVGTAEAGTKYENVVKVSSGSGASFYQIDEEGTQFISARANVSVVQAQ